MATTPRPLIFERVLTVASDVDNAGRTVQFENGNGRIYYQKDNTLYYKPVSVTQGHWQNMTIGNESQESDLDIKDYAIDQATPDASYGLAIVSTQEDDKDIDVMYLMKDDYSLNTHTEKIIRTIL